MTTFDDHRDRPTELDPWTTDQLLLGRLGPEDAPPGYAGVARLVTAARRPGSPEEIAGVDAAVLSALVVLTEERRDREPLLHRAERARRVVKAKIGAVVFAGTLVGTSGLAAAGVLPDPLQHAASKALSTVGIHVPDPNHGSEVSDVAKTTDLTGRDKGAAISDAARDNHGHSDERGPNGKSDGTHGKSDDPHGKSDEPHGKSDEPHGKSDEPHGKADEPHGKPEDPPGSKANNGNDGNDGDNGRSEEPHGNNGSSTDTGSPGPGSNDSEPPATDPPPTPGSNGGGNGNGAGDGAKGPQGGDPGGSPATDDPDGPASDGDDGSNGGGNGNGNGGNPHGEPAPSRV